MLFLGITLFLLEDDSFGKGVTFPRRIHTTKKYVYLDQGGGRIQPSVELNTIVELKSYITIDTIVSAVRCGSF